ncbi:hypothetical protein LCGC14_1863820, partial [marine sediment metagenome]
FLNLAEGLLGRIVGAKIVEGRDCDQHQGFYPGDTTLR